MEISTSFGPVTTSGPKLKFPGSAVVKVKSGLIAGRINTLLVIFPEPQLLHVETTHTQIGDFFVSECVLPGADPYGGTKTCQDLVFLKTYQDGQVLCGLFDGHGSEGKSVVDFCKDFTIGFADRNMDFMRKEPEKFLLKLNTECHNGLIDGKNNIDCIFSGSTAVLALFQEKIWYFSNLGDSRAVLGTTAFNPIPVLIQPTRGFDQELQTAIKTRRSVTSQPGLTSIQMTKDQKPEDSEELSRITAQGGVVSCIADKDGNPTGPYRVWKAEGVYPGISMSRSLGDSMAHSIGVLSTPVVSCRKMEVGEDLFIVIASDGVWDVMEDQEVCDFVEKYRHSSQRTNSEAQSPATELNSNISRLLCEEARVRWLSVVEVEGAIIDDISCIVLEMPEIASFRPELRVADTKMGKDEPVSTQSSEHDRI